MGWRWNSEKLTNRISDYGTGVELSWQCLLCSSAVNVPFTGTPPQLSLFWKFFCFGFFFSLSEEVETHNRLRQYKPSKGFFANSFSGCMPGSSGVLQHSFLCCWHTGGWHFYCGNILTKAVTEMNEAALRQVASGLKHAGHCSWYLLSVNVQVALEKITCSGKSEHCNGSKMSQVRAEVSARGEG